MAAGCGIAEFVMLLVGAAMFSWNLPPGMPIAMGIMVPFIAGGGQVHCIDFKRDIIETRRDGRRASFGDKVANSRQDL